MLLTAPLLSKSSFFGSLVNKFRQVNKKLPSTSTNKIIESDTKLNNDLKPTSTPPPTLPPSTPTSTPPQPLPTVASISNAASRPQAVANLSHSSPASAPKTLEEQVGLPPRPKKPLTPYFRYMKEMRPKVLADNPKYSTVDVVRLVSKQWESAAPTVKKRLQDDFKREQQQYVEIRAKYDATISDQQRAEIKQLKQDLVEAKERRELRKRVKELGRPKKPASAFLRFISHERTNSPQSSKQTYREWHKKVTEKWSRLTDKEKDVFIKEARKELDVYKKEITLWEEKMVRLGHIDVVRHGNLIDPPEPKAKKQ